MTTWKVISESHADSSGKVTVTTAGGKTSSYQTNTGSGSGSSGSNSLRTTTPTKTNGIIDVTQYGKGAVYNMNTGLVTLPETTSKPAAVVMTGGSSSLRTPSQTRSSETLFAINPGNDVISNILAANQTTTTSTTATSNKGFLSDLWSSITNNSFVKSMNEAQATGALQPQWYDLLLGPVAPLIRTSNALRNTTPAIEAKTNAITSQSNALRDLGQAQITKAQTEAYNTQAVDYATKSWYENIPLLGDLFKTPQEKAYQAQQAQDIGSALLTQQEDNSLRGSTDGTTAATGETFTDKVNSIGKVALIGGAVILAIVLLPKLFKNKG